jgi:hypothetical protein
LARGLHQRRAAQLRPRVEIRPVGDQQPSHAEVTSEGPGMASMAPGTVENLWKIHGKWMEMDGKWMEIEFTHGNFRSHLVLHFQNCLQFCKVLVNHGLEIGKP